MKRKIFRRERDPDLLLLTPKIFFEIDTNFFREPFLFPKFLRRKFQAHAQFSHIQTMKTPPLLKVIFRFLCLAKVFEQKIICSFGAKICFVQTITLCLSTSTFFIVSAICVFQY